MSSGEDWRETLAYKALLKTATYDRIILSDLVGIALRGYTAMSYSMPATLPDPTGELYDWLADMARLPPEEWITIDIYQRRAKSESDSVLHMIAISQLISSARQLGVVEVTEQMPEGDTETINHYQMKPEARAFWTNGFTAKMDNQKILKGWRALQGIANDIRREPDE